MSLPDDSMHADVTTDFTPSHHSEFSFLQVSDRPDAIGRLGHYDILEVLGRGGFGIVFRAFDAVLQRVVAIKVLAPEMAATSPARKRFLREARAAAQVRHENVVQIYAVEEQPLPYLVMEFVPGETLQQRLDRIGPVDVAEIVSIGRQTADGLAAAHAAGLIHRDIKPANILIETGPKLRVKITDFGLARAEDDASITQSGVVAGTPMYMSPEQARGETLDHRTDLFSLGSVLYAITSGRPPFRAGNTFAVLKRVTEEQPRAIAEVIPETPAWLNGVIAKLMAKDPDKRYQSAMELSIVLETAATAPLATAFIPERPSHNLRTRLLAVGALALVPLLVLFFYWLTRDSLPHPAPNLISKNNSDPGVSEPKVVSAKTSVSPLDRLKRENVSPDLLALAGGGDPKKAPSDLMAVLGGSVPYIGTSKGVVRPDGAVFAGIISGSGQIAFWDIATGKASAPLLEVSTPASNVVTLAYSHDGKRLATGTVDGTVAVWDCETRAKIFSEQINSIPGHLQFSRDGKWLACGWTKAAKDPHEGWVKIWDATTLKEARCFGATTPGVACDLHAMAFSPDSTQLAVGTITEEIRRWNPATGEEIGARRRNPGGVYCLAFAPDGKQFAVGAGDGTISIWDPEIAQPLESLSGKGVVFVVAYSQDGRYLAWGNEAGQVQVRDLKKKETRLALSFADQVRLVTFTPDSNVLIASSIESGRPPKVWITESGVERPGFAYPSEAPEPSKRGHSKKINSVDFNQDGSLLASCGDDGIVKVWDLANLTARHTLDSGPANSVAFSSDGLIIAVGCKAGVVSLFDAASGTAKQSLRGHTDAVTSVAFSRDGKWLASASADRTIKLWPLDADRPERTLQGCKDIATSVAFSPDRTIVAAGSRDGTVRRWLVVQPEDLPPLANPTNSAILSLAFRPTDKILVTGDKALRIDAWHIEDGSVNKGAAVHPLTEPSPGIVGLAWSDDGRWLASCSTGSGVRFWDWSTTPPQFRTYEIPNPSAIALTARGRYLAVASGNLICILRFAPPPPL